MGGSLFSGEARLRTLMIASIAGDAVAYRGLLADLTVQLRAYFRKRLSAALAPDAEDLVQETLLALHSRRATYDATRPFTASVHPIAPSNPPPPPRRRYPPPVPDVDAIESAAGDDESAGTEAQLDVSSLLATTPAGPRAWIRGVRIEGRSV